MNEATKSIVKTVESIFPHRLYENRQALDEVRRQIAEIPASERDDVVRDLEGIDTGFGSSFGEENWAICMSLLGSAAKCAPKVWSIAKSASNRPADFAAVCDALASMKHGLPPLAPEIVSMFNDTVKQLPSEFARCTNEACRYAVGVECPCSLVRLLAACGRGAEGAARALRKYKWFIAGKQFIQSSMTVIDLDAGEVRAPPASPEAQVEVALRAVMGIRYYIRKVVIAAVWAAVLVAVWWWPLGNWPLWVKIILSVPSTVYFLCKIVLLGLALIGRGRD